MGNKTGYYRQWIFMRIAAISTVIFCQIGTFTSPNYTFSSAGKIIAYTPIQGTN